MRVTKPGLLLLITLFGSVVLGATSPIYQEERLIYGKVTDENGAPLPNVNVTLEHAQSDVIHGAWTKLSKTTTSPTGEYKFSANTVGNELPMGDYRLTFEYPGLVQVSRTTFIGPYAAGSGTMMLVQEINVHLRENSIAGIGARRYIRRPRPSVPPPDNVGRSEDAPGPISSPAPPSPTPSPEPRPTLEATATPRPTSSNANVSANTNTSANANASPRHAQPTSSEIDRILKSLDLGNIAFNTPESMSLIDAKKVELLLSTSLSKDALKNAVAQYGVEGDIQVEEIQISDQMEANLSGDGFQITEVLPARRPISKTGTTEWTWDVRALKEGKLRLHLTLNALVTVKGNPQLYPIRTFDKEYVVTVGVKDKVVSFAQNNWKWLWTTLFVPLGGWLLKRKRKSSEAAA